MPPGPPGTLPPKVHAFLESGPLAHVVTLNADGSPQVSVAWVGVEAGEIVIGSMFDQPKLQNLRRDPRVSLSFDAPGRTDLGLDHYLVVHGRARLTAGGAPELLGRLAKRYLGPDAVFPAMPNPPDGWVIRIAVERVVGIGDWR
jgi:PPOX class probable F420-dependent enzyme